MWAEESSFSVWVKQRRRALDLTQEDLADCVGCSRATIQKIEEGERRPSRQVALRLADCLRLPSDEQEGFVRFARGASGGGGRSPGEDATLAPAQPEPLGAPTLSDHPNPNNLPAPLTLLLGRGAAVTAAGDYLLREGIRLLTFTGELGIGKTRLSLQVAADLLPHFRDGVFFVQLAPIRDPSLVASTIATTLGLPESDSRSIRNDLKNFLTGKSMLLVLDNFEQVLDAAPLVIELLGSCPGLKVLVTSREALHVPGEQQFPVPPLALPDLARLPGIQTLLRYPAIALFLERAQAVDPAFRLSEENAHDVTTICTRLDGLPLAIELAAARARLLSTAEMSARLDKQLSLLTGPARYQHFQHLPARQQTIRAAIEWSYRLLEASEQQLLSQLGVFVGGWTLEAAEAVCGPGALDGIESLLGKSLLKRADSSGDGRREYRFTMLESIREYALERLGEAEVDEGNDEGDGGEADEVRRRHALYFLEFAERAEPHLTGEEQAEWFQRLEREHSNLRAAISWSLARGGAEEDIALRFGGALVMFWYNRYPAEGRWWLEGAMKDGAREPSLARARALYSAAMALRKTRQYPQARSMIEESLRMYRELGDESGIARSINKLADLMQEVGPPEEMPLAEKLYAESIERFRAIGDQAGMSRVLNSIGEWARAEGDYPRAIDAYEKSLAVLDRAADKQGIATTQTNMAYVLYHCEEYDRAKALLAEALLAYKAIESAFNAGWALFAMAGISRVQGDPHKAGTLVGAANALAAQAGTPFDPIDQQDREEIEAAIRADLSNQDWQSAQEQGRIMSMDEAIDYALGRASSEVSELEGAIRSIEIPGEA